MEAKKFRLGNIVIDAEDRADKNLFVISRIETKEYTNWNSGDEYLCVANTIDCKDCYYEIKPFGLRLTDDLLTQLGFVKDKTEIEFYYKDDFQIQLPAYFKYKDSFLRKLKYVHELQNLFAALTGRELELKTDV